MSKVDMEESKNRSFIMTGRRASLVALLAGLVVLIASIMFLLVMTVAFQSH